MKASPDKIWAFGRTWKATKMPSRNFRHPEWLFLRGELFFRLRKSSPLCARGVFLHQLFQFIKVGTHVLVADVIVVQTAAEVLVIGSHVDESVT